MRRNPSTRQYIKRNVSFQENTIQENITTQDQRGERPLSVSRGDEPGFTNTTPITTHIQENTQENITSQENTTQENPSQEPTKPTKKNKRNKSMKKTLYDDILQDKTFMNDIAPLLMI